MDELEFIKRFSGSEISNRMAKSIGDILQNTLIQCLR